MTNRQPWVSIEEFITSEFQRKFSEHAKNSEKNMNSGSGVKLTYPKITEEFLSNQGEIMKTEEALMMGDKYINKNNAIECILKLQALLDGKTLQFNDCGHWYDVPASAASIAPSELLKMRIKPEPKTAWYRVAETDFGTITVNNVDDELILAEPLHGFKRWLTERVTYEVKE